MDPAYTSGTGTPVPGGLTPREVFGMVRGLCSENNLVGFDLVELNPLVDPGYTTVLNAKKGGGTSAWTGVAMRKLGLGDRDYLSPLTRDDGRKPVGGRPAYKPAFLAGGVRATISLPALVQWKRRNVSPIRTPLNHARGRRTKCPSLFWAEMLLLVFVHCGEEGVLLPSG